jgi:hypothetical protein
MPIDNIAEVTQKIRDMIKARVDPFLAPAAATTTSVSPQSVTSGTNVVSVYLFHWVEDPFFKNQPPPPTGSGPVPVSHTPLALNLNYVVTAHNPDQTTDPDQRVMQEQRLLGLVAKAVHDEPLLTLDNGDEFELILRPVGIEESVNFWSSDEQHLTRMSLYVEARIILLQPEPPKTVPGMVLSVNTFVFIGLGPQLTTSRSVLTIVPPVIGARQLNAEPARVALFDPTDPVASELVDNNRLDLFGVDFGRGPRLLELESGAVRVRVAIDQSAPQNANWEIFIAEGKISLRFWTAVFDALSNAQVPRPALPPDPAVPPLLPGVYTARVVDDQPPRPRTSNAIAFAVIPQVKSVTLISGNAYTLEISGTYLGEPSLQLELVVGSEILTLGAGTPPPAGSYALPAAGNSIVFQRTPVANELIDPAHPLPVNLRINGVNATPSWITEKGP